MSHVQPSLYCHYTYSGEYAEVVVDFGGRVEDLVLKSRSQGKLRSVLLTHNGNATAIKENSWWKGMLLVPWANRIAYVSGLTVYHKFDSTIFALAAIAAKAPSTFAIV